MSSLKKKTAKAFAWDIAGTFLRQGSGFIISIFLARLLSPEEFGLVGMAMVFISISQVFIDVGFASALIQNKENTNLTYSSVFYLNLAAGLILTCIFYFSAPLIGQFYQNQAITELVRWMSLIFVFNSLNLVQGAILRRELNFKVLTMRGVIASFVGGVVGVVMAFLDFGVYALVGQQLSTAILGTILLWTTSHWKPDFNFSMDEVKKLTGFSAYVFFDRFASTIFQNLDVMLIGKVFSPATLGFYTRAVSLKSQVTKYSSASLSKVFFPVLSGLQDNHEEFSRVYFKVVSVVSFVSFGLTGVLYILGSEIIIGLFGTKWSPSVPIFQVLVISVCTYPINSMMVNAFMSKGKSKENFYIGLFRKTIKIIPLFIAYFYGILAFTIAFVIVEYFLTITNIVFLNKFAQIEPKKHFRKIFEGLIPLSLAILCFHLFASDSSIIKVLLSVMFALIYLLYNSIIKAEGYIFLRDNAYQKILKRFKIEKVH